MLRIAQKKPLSFLHNCFCCFVEKTSNVDILLRYSYLIYILLNKHNRMDINCKIWCYKQYSVNVLFIMSYDLYKPFPTCFTQNVLESQNSQPAKAKDFSQVSENSKNWSLEGTKLVKDDIYGYYSWHLKQSLRLSKETMGGGWVICLNWNKWNMSS